MDTDLVDNTEAPRFELRAGEDVLGFIDYRLSDTRIDLVHIEVDPAHEGEGHAAALARGALDDARSRGLTVVPSYPYVATYIDKHPEYADLVHQPG